MNKLFIGLKMNINFEDKFGRFLMMAIFNGLFMIQILNLWNTFDYLERDFLWFLDLFSKFCNAIFLGLILYFTIHRLPSQKSAPGAIPRIVAIGGTFLMMFLVVLPPEQIGPIRQVASALLIIVGASLSSWCLFHLGRSFSIMATARELKTSGTYAIVRHPLYGAEVLMMTGVMLGHGSPFAFALGALWLSLQIGRAQFEEGILRKTFPEYDDYAQRVPMMVPMAKWLWWTSNKTGS
jgi:protein-S-isoprenylcysteine O-methyltransferase Ste14